MTLLWTTPRTWVTKEPITKEKLNAISNNLQYLFAPSVGLVTVRGTATDVNITATSPAAIDDATLALSVELSGRMFRVKFQVVLANSTLGVFNMLDVLIDGTTYLSSLTGTPLTNGVWRQKQYVAAAQMQATFDILVPVGVLNAGVHTFAPRAWVSANTMTVSLGAGSFTQFAVSEF